MSLQPKKTKEQIKAMQEGGQILATIFRDLRAFVKPGMTGLEVDKWVGEQLKKHGATPTYKEPEVNFPGNICISINENIVHCVPKDIPFEIGDVVKFDIVISYKGMKTDSAFTIIIGEQPKGIKKHLLDATERSLYAGIAQVKPGAHIGDISAAVEKVLVKAKLGIIRELVGHGIGDKMHLPPEVPNYGKKGTGPVLSVGDTIAIEPMASLGKEKIAFDKEDGWSIFMKDGSLSAHFEHTVLVTEDGYQILTKLDD